MNLKKSVILMAGLVFGAASSLAQAADVGHGKVTFKGSIVEAPCSIASDSQNQLVEMDGVATAALKNGGKSQPTSFTIELLNCDLTVGKKTVTTTFNGQRAVTGKDDMLAMAGGTASGAGIVLTDGQSNVIKLGSPTEAQPLGEGNNTLQFAAYLQGLSASGGVVPGTFNTIANFTLAYQ